MSADLSKLDNVPTELRPLSVWLLWKSQPNGKGKKPKKIPYYADGTRRGQTDTAEDRERLVTLDVAVSKYRKTFSGLGVALGPVPSTSIHLSGIDLDHCVRGDDIAPRARDVLGTPGEPYAEISPSHTGIKLFGTGDIGTTKEAELEIYSAGRFFAVTGDRIQGEHLTDLTTAAAVARRILGQLRPSGSRRSIPEGKRNIVLHSFACSLRARSTPEDAAWRLLQERNQDSLPPLDARELKVIFDSAWKHPPGFKLTDLGNAERLVASHGDDLRYIEGGGWGTWDAHRWQLEQGRGRVMVMMANVVRGMYVEAAREDDEARRKNLAAHARASESRNRLEASVALAQWQPGVTDKISDYDKDPLTLGLRNGVYDLERDEFREGQREDRILLQADVAFDSKATAPRWEEFQAEIHDGNMALVSFKRRAWGYTLSGDTSEQKLFMPYGEGSNGKSTELAVALALLSDYARKVEPETLLVRDKRGASNDIARLRGARFVATVEVEDGGRMAESLVKQLTGEDPLAARFMYQEYFEFLPVCKIWLASNHKPEIVGTDYAIWRRILLIPYLVKFEGLRKDPKLKQALIAELPGILNWMIAGFREWKEVGLSPPEAVVGATDEYRTDMDRVGNFLRECCQYGPTVPGRTHAAKIYRSYVRWMEFNGLKPVRARKFHERMERDHQLFRVDGRAGRLSDYKGLLLVTTHYERGDIDA